MPTRLARLIVLAATLFTLTGLVMLARVTPAHAYANVNVSLFYDRLSPYGRWVDESPYGWCWVPARVGPGWRPYSAGYWVYTDYGWTWESDEPWGWAAYHYGRWFYDP